MIQKLFVVMVAVMVVVHEASAAPGHRSPDLPALPDVCELIDSALQGIVGNLADPVVPEGPIEIKIIQDHVFNIYIKMDDNKISGLKDFAVRDCAYQYDTGSETRVSISIAVRSPEVKLETNHYFLNGSVVDHIDLYGQGPGMISVDEMDVSVKGTATVTIFPQFALVFDSAVLDLEMWRWTVNLEDLMPGTDLGTVFNEFFSMYGPAIFDVIENNINNSGKLLDFLNNLFQ